MRGCDSGGELMWSARSVGEKKDKKQFRCGARISGNRPSPAGPGLRRKTEETEREDNHSQESAAHDGPFEKASTQGPASPRHAS